MDEDLTASHWDDVLLPSKNDLSVSNHFHSLAIDDPHRDPEVKVEEYDLDNDRDDNNDEETPYDEGETDAALEMDRSSQQGLYSSLHRSFLPEFSASAPSEFEQEERRQKNAAMVDQLTAGADKLELEAASRLVLEIDSSAALFADKGSPIKIDSSSNAAPQSPTRAPALKNGKLRTKRFRKYPPLTVVTHLKGDVAPVNDPLLSAGPDPSKDSRLVSGASDKQKDIVKDMNAPLYDVPSASESQAQDHIGSGPLLPSSEISAGETTPKNGRIGKQPTSGASYLKISVGDPVKVGDITTAHIVYQIRTVNDNPDSTVFQGSESIVSRRYKDFRWIYHQLQSNHPGRIIPPPPAKQTYIGRFNENFVENRRMSLEKMLSKISKVSCLADDPDFIMFLTSNDFANESKERESASGSAASHASLADDDNDSSSPSVISSSGGPQGFISSLFSMAPKIEEPDEFFANKKVYIQDLEFNLKTFSKSLEMIVTQRVETISVVEQLSSSFEELADVEILKKTKDLLSAFANVNEKLKDNLERVNLQEQLTLGFTIEEYLRIIGSIKYVFETRTRIYHQLHTFQSDLSKKEESLEKLTSKYKSSVDKINMLKFEVDKLQQKVAYFSENFKSISETIRSELDTFEIEKIDDFRNSVEIYIESSIESQKEAIETWETFYERHNLSSV